MLKFRNAFLHLRRYNSYIVLVYILDGHYRLYSLYTARRDGRNGILLLELIEIVNRVLIAAPFSGSLIRTCQSVHLIGHDSCLPHAWLHVLENLIGTAGWSPAAMAAGAYRPNSAA